MDIKISPEVHPIIFNSVIPCLNFTTDVQNYTDSTLALVDCTDLTKFVTNTLIAGTLCLLGLVGNSVSFVVLMMDEDSKVAAITSSWPCGSCISPSRTPSRISRWSRPFM